MQHFAAAGGTGAYIHRIFRWVFSMMFHLRLKSAVQAYDRSYTTSRLKTSSGDPSMKSVE